MKAIISLLFSFLFSPAWLILSQAADGDYQQDCYPKRCGPLVNVTFPFWFRELQPEHCGLPAFELRCEHDVPRLVLLQEDNRVLNISYENRTATISTAKFAEANGCDLPYYNLSFSLSAFAISSANRELVFVYNCTAPTERFVKFSCLGRNIYAYLGGAYQRTEDGGVFHQCFAAVMPVLSSPGSNVDHYKELLAKGFLLDWNAPDCSECLRSHGQCGYNNSTRNFMCICSDRPHWKSCSEGSSNTRLKIGLSTGVVGFVMFFLCFLLYRRWKKSHPLSSNLKGRNSCVAFTSKEDPELGSAFNTPIFSYNELYKATDGFSSANELGDGGFGTVYKGKLKDGRVVAVKRLYKNNYRRLEQFMNEVTILSLLRHQNLVSLYGYTSIHSCELLLVYEYAPNGTVADHLHGCHSSETVLPWQVRMSIAIETADALNYLHSVEPQIIHRDVKTNNILLDKSFHAKVADFGLSRLFPLDATHVSTLPQGTPGYVDPEYHQCFQLTDKSDVYSFGVVLMELISSKPAVDISRDRNEVNLANFAMRKIQKQELHELVDQRLGYHSDSNVNRMINMVAALAFRCLQTDRETRPGIKEVLEILRGIEGSVSKNDGCLQVADAGKEETSLLKSGPPYSPNSVTEAWISTASSMSRFSE